MEKDWIPTEEGTSLYIRPFIIAVDPHVDVHPAQHLIFLVICSPWALIILRDSTP